MAGQLRITIDTHNHILAPNPFIYKVHNKATPQYQQAVGLALGHRLAHEGFCEDLARQNIVAHLSQLQLGSGVVTYGLRVVTCGLRAVTYGLRAITYVTCCHI